MNNITDYISTTEAAKLLGISRIAVFKKIKKNQIKHFRLGRNFFIPKEEIERIKQEKREMAELVVERLKNEYEEALRKLAIE